MDKQSLKKPPLEEGEGSARMFLDGGTLVAELDLMALADFRWSLYFLATTCPRGEDISIWTSRSSEEQNGDAIGYCEITLTGEGPVMGVLHNPNAEFLHRGNRVDLFVNRMQAEVAYRNLEALSGTEIGQETTLFGRLIVRTINAIIP